MATGKEVEKRGHVVGFREEIAKAAAVSDDAFFTWFDTAKDADASFVRGSWDFVIHIALPASRFLTKPEEKTALEIGHGGGRLLAAASRHFGAVIGVDIHDQNETVEAQLKRRGVGNVRLLKSNGQELPVESSSVDFVYSFIVLQHVEKHDILARYMNETSRALKLGGIAVIYFGRRQYLSVNATARWRYLADLLIERLLLRKGYRELPAKVNVTNLVVSLAHAKALAKANGFEVLAELVSRKNVPDRIRQFGGQHGLVLRKR